MFIPGSWNFGFLPKKLQLAKYGGLLRRFDQEDCKNFMQKFCKEKLGLPDITHTIGLQCCKTTKDLTKTTLWMEIISIFEDFRHKYFNYLNLGLEKSQKMPKKFQLI